MRINEVIQPIVVAKQFDDLVENHYTGFKSTASLQKIIQSPISKMFRNIDSNIIYRAWALSPTRACKLYGYPGPNGKGQPETGEGIVMSVKRPFLSYSWSEQGAKARTNDDDFWGDSAKVAVIVKHELKDSADVLFNVGQYAREAKEKLGIDPVDKIGMVREQEVVLRSDPYYLTINPDEVVWFSHDPWELRY